MAITAGDQAWVAVFEASGVYIPTDQIIEAPYPALAKIPVVVWQEACIDNVTSIQGYVLQDRDGNPLPYPVPAQLVFGFLFYERVNR